VTVTGKDQHAAMTADSSRDASAAEQERALAVLILVWGHLYDEISVRDGQWAAHPKDAPDDDLITGSTPRDLNDKIRDDCLRRAGA
jgi:hypothetical protein